jgi:hypothetical protein
MAALPTSVNPKDFIMGKLSPAYAVVDSMENDMIVGNCFGGMRLKSCTSTLPNDDFVKRDELSYYTQTLQRSGSEYCLGCCGTSPAFTDSWKLRCPVDLFTAITSNIYGYEGRFAVRSFLGDYSIVTCPLRRSACAYRGNTLLGCNATDDTFLWGYSLTLDVVEYSDATKYWRGVSACNFVTYEKKVPMASGDIFTETIVLNYRPQKFNATNYYNLL